VILYRCFAWNQRAQPDAQDGPLWFPRIFQGDGRHDNPELYGCLYLSASALSTVVEQLARFRTQRLTPALLRRRALPLAVAELELSDRSTLIDLDDPAVLRRHGLRPSRVATRRRDITQALARRFHDAGTGILGLRWWSTYEALWPNVTIFDRAAAALQVRSVTALSIDDAIVIEAADFFALRIP
jgi:hypothetical protein